MKLRNMGYSESMTKPKKVNALPDRSRSDMALAKKILEFIKRSGASYQSAQNALGVSQYLIDRAGLKRE